MQYYWFLPQVQNHSSQGLIEMLYTSQNTPVLQIEAPGIG